MPLSFALSITHFFTSAGADAGFAALIGLAILVLLYFAHARETSTLRDQLEAATRRIEQLERRLGGGAAPSIGAKQPAAAQASSTPLLTTSPAATTGSQPAPAGASAQATGAPSMPAPPPVTPRPLSAPPVAARPLSAPPVVAPAGVGAPPLSDATRVVPLAQPAGDREDPEPVPGEHGVAAGDGVGATSPPLPGVTPSPVTAAAGGNGFAGASATKGGSRSLLEHGLPTQGKVPRWVIAVLGVVLVAVIAVVLVLILHPGSSHHNTAKVVHHDHAAPIAAAPAGVTPSLVTVAVVNATNVNELAHHVSTRLTALHFQPGTLATATNQSHANTTVGYLPGHRDDALAVAHALKLPASAVRPVAQSSEGLVCPNPSDCTADVIVVAGPNLAPKR
ncbi:MAG TPA: LytR C-terminal domain-containing protein [Solirubrobacteraceae bacterium]|nr:LytR C-terminal domain-containing protein [Solirubrobacteraceae bacterium]